MPKKKQYDAMDRANELLVQVPRTGLPPLAKSYAQQLCQTYGMCGEVVLTAFAHYAQEVEGLPCPDRAYKSDKDAKAFFKTALAAQNAASPKP